MQIKNTNEILFCVINSAEFEKIQYYPVLAMAGRCFSHLAVSGRSLKQSRAVHGHLLPDPSSRPEPHPRPFQDTGTRRLVPGTCMPLKVSSALLTVKHLEFCLWTRVEPNGHFRFCRWEYELQNLLKSYATRPTILSHSNHALFLTL